MDALPKRRPPSARVFWLSWLTIIALTVASSFYVARLGPMGSQPAVFRRVAGKSEMFPLRGATAPIRVSDRGVVWARTRLGLSRLENGAWHTFTSSDLGTPYDSLVADFALDGEDVWAMAASGVLHFDGSRWMLHARPAGTQQAVAIAAAKGEAWTIDTAGNLAHYDGAKWSVRRVESPGIPHSAWTATHSYRQKPKLALASDGKLWLILEGVWRFDGTKWAQVPGTTRKAVFLGVTPASSYRVNGKEESTGGGVYVLDGGEVVGLDTEGRAHFRYDVTRLGKSAWVYEISGRAPTFVLAYSGGLYRYDGKDWIYESKQDLGVIGVSAAAVAPDQSVWGLGQVEAAATPAQQLAGWTNLGLLFLAVGYPFWYRGRKAAYERAAAKEAVLHATGQLPDDLKGPETKTWHLGLGVILFFAVGAAAWFALKKYWPAAPGWLLPVCFIALHILTTLTGSLKKRQAQPNDPIQPGGAPQVDWEKSQPALLGGLAVLVLLYGGQIARYLHIPYAAAMPGFAFLLGGQFLFRQFDRFRVKLVNRQVSQGNYAKARQILDGPLAWPPSGLWKLAQAEMLYYAGRAAEAEPLVREQLESNTRLRASAMETLGRVLLAQSRYDDARRAFEAAAKMAPSNPAAYLGLAEVRLMQGVAAEQALEDVQQARKVNTDRARLAAICGDEAWSLGILGRSGEVQESIERGAREVDRSHKPELAGFHWRAGMAFLALEQTTVALQWLVKAAELDPEGYYGNLAARHRSERSVWGRVGMSVRAL
jgi:tetratricopeptide (TPR) repeat protein